MQNAMPSFRSWRELIGNLTEGSEWKDRVCNPSPPNATPEQGKRHTLRSSKCGIDTREVWHCGR
ncbi:hypothetical protein [Bacteroides intestinalis]|uniref:Uncharacterized protein n=2 Tax=Bacteroides intestinalis TaxID=329854 RepID=A0A414LA42_9BACE|nr:hypothetical protein [Bacteroides intestinalis]RHE91510.1 hypothetical protein DW712_11985 [Bacteroides intestinalis]